MELRRDQVRKLTPADWVHIDMAVSSEASRTRVAAQFLPSSSLGDGADDSVPADSIYEDSKSNTLLAQRGATTAFIEIGAKFGMTEQQVDAQERVRTAVTLATRRTNLLMRAEDLLIFQGQERDATTGQ